MAAAIIDDDSRGFAELEREHVRRKYLPDFEWTRYDTPSARVPLPVPLNRARVGLVDTCGAHLVGEAPVGSSGRAALMPVDAEITLTHSGYDVERALRDTAVVHPVRTLPGLADDGFIGEVAATAVSVMGGVLIAKRLLDRGVPAAVDAMREELVDLALLVPA